MGISYIKRGTAIDIYYEGYKRETGLTVQGNAYKPNGTIYAGQPFAFTHFQNGVYKATLTATSDDGWHIVLIDATNPGKSAPGVFKFRAEANSIQEIHDLVSAVDTKVTDLQGATFDTATDSNEAIRNRLDAGLGAGFSTGTDSLEAIRDAISALQTSIDNVEGTVHAVVLMDDEFTVPPTGTVRYQVDIRNYSQTGMKNFDSAPTMAVAGSDGNTYTTRLYTLGTGGVQQATMVSIATGHYRLFFETEDTDLSGVRLYFTISGTEDGETFSYQGNSAWVDDIAAGGFALEATLTTMKQTTAGTFDRDTDSLEALRNRVDALAGATFNAGTDTLEALRDNQDAIKGVGFAGGTHDLVTLRGTMDDLLRYTGGRAH